MSNQITTGIVYGVLGGVAVLLLAIFKKPVKCPNCGTVQPRFRKPENRQQALWGGWTCPQCQTSIDRSGKAIPTQKQPRVLLLVQLKIGWR
jgi:hypothetical protein